MTNPKFESIEQYRDVESLNIYDIKLKEGLSKEEIIGILKQNLVTTLALRCSGMKR